MSLSALSGYEIYYYGDTSVTAGLVVPVTGGSQTTYTITGVKAGTYHFAISSIDTSGMKSALSTPVNVTFGP